MEEVMSNPPLPESEPYARHARARAVRASWSHDQPSDAGLKLKRGDVTRQSALPQDLRQN